MYFKLELSQNIETYKGHDRKGPVPTDFPYTEACYPGLRPIV